MLGIARLFSASALLAVFSSASALLSFDLVKDRLIDVLVDRSYPWDHLTTNLAQSPQEVRDESRLFLNGSLYLPDFYKRITTLYPTCSDDVILQLIKCYCCMFAEGSTYRALLAPNDLSNLKVIIDGLSLPIDNRFWFISNFSARIHLTMIDNIIKSYIAPPGPLDGQIILSIWLVLTSTNTVEGFSHIDPFGLIRFSLNHYLDLEKIDANTVPLFLTSAKLHISLKMKGQVALFLADALEYFPNNIPRTPNNISAFLGRVIQMMHSTSNFCLQHLSDHSALSAAINEIETKISALTAPFSVKTLIELVYDEVFSPTIKNLVLDLLSQYKDEKFLQFSDLASEADTKKFEGIGMKKIQTAEYIYLGLSSGLMATIIAIWLMKFSKKPSTK